MGPVSATRISEDAIRLAGGSTSSTYTALERLEEDRVIHEVTNRRRDRVWGATEVLIELDRLSGAIAERTRATRADGSDGRRGQHAVPLWEAEHRNQAH